MNDKEALMEEHKEHVKKSRSFNPRYWKWVSLALAVLLIIVLVAQGIPDFGLMKNARADDALKYLNDEVLGGFATAELNEVKEENGMYVLDIELISVAGQTQDATIYLSKDGELMFPTVIPLEEDNTEPTDVETEPTEEEVVEVDVTGQPFIGNEDAKVTIVEFSDFQCPYCEKGYTTMKEVLANYPEDVKIVFINFPLSFHEYAQKAAEAGECAFAQGKFEEYHDMLFENQDALTLDDLKKYAVDLGLDTEAFNTCLDSDEMASKVEDDMAYGSELGISGTPAFFINGQKITGARPYADFETAIEEALAGDEEVVAEEAPAEEEVVVEETA
jgi:protein-disulfide isomerase